MVVISWLDAVAYCGWLGSETGKSYRLPSEAEWEYACRARTTTRYAFGGYVTPKDANYNGRLERTREVGAYPPNAWGLYDMHGNVWEWLEDVFHASYDGAPNDGSAWIEAEGIQSSDTPIYRGGSWLDNPRGLRSALRNGNSPDYRIDNLGFRVARTLS